LNAELQDYVSEILHHLGPGLAVAVLGGEGTGLLLSNRHAEHCLLEARNYLAETKRKLKRLVSLAGGVEFGA
jgi:hypothetical protein